MKEFPMSISKLVLCLFILTFPRLVLSWRELGHFSVCEIAYRNLRPVVKDKVDRLVGKNKYSKECTWPDLVRKTPEWKFTYLWHFINIEDGKKYKENINEHGDTLFALFKYEEILRDRSKSLEERKRALKFYSHFVGDLHQPLHVGRRSDLGGNRIKVSWYGKSTFNYNIRTLEGMVEKEKGINLHKVLDLHILEKFLEVKGIKDSSPYSYMAFSDYLIKTMGPHKNKWTGLTYFDWMNESVNARGSLYNVGNGKLGDLYYNKSIPIILERIRQAGIRLGHRLNAIFLGKKVLPKDLSLKKKLIKFGKNSILKN